MDYPRQFFAADLTPWHITFGTYGTRLHGGDRPTVDKQHNKRGEVFVGVSAHREQFERSNLKFRPRFFTMAQRRYAEEVLLAICDRGGWGYRICAAGSDHIHLLCDVAPAVHGETVRRLVKRWLGQSLSELWPLPPKARWWADEGSNIAVDNESYLNNVFRYIAEQRTIPWPPGQP
jgi:REP element-mobilizing transposase RayT